MTQELAVAVSHYQEEYKMRKGKIAWKSHSDSDVCVGLRIPGLDL